MRLGSFLEGIGLSNGEDFNFESDIDLTILTNVLKKPQAERKQK